jgi:LmbE family N-acetylglucosaminyl deacetylase
MSQPETSDQQSKPDNRDTPQHILVILAHPDDPEFFCGGTIARWTDAGHRVTYCLLTCGDKGTKDFTTTSESICRLRQAEQTAAASVLGVHQVRFLDYPDGYLVPDLELRRDITRIIREMRPDVVVTCDPTNLYVRETLLNHPDHRAAGQAALDAIYPAARDHLNFIELWRDENLEPHVVRDVWVASPKEPTITMDVTEQWEIKIKALFEHKSQIGDLNAFEKRMRDRHTQDSTPENPRYVENFRRLI